MRYHLLEEDETRVHTESLIKYRNIIDLHQVIIIKEELSQFYGKIHTGIMVPTLIMQIYSVLLVFQVILPSLFADYDRLWTDNTILHGFIKVLSAVYAGPFTNPYQSRVISGFVVILVVIICISVIIFRAKMYAKTGFVDKAEMMTIMILSKFVIQLFLPFISASIPYAIYAIVSNGGSFMSYFIVVFALPVIVLFLYFFYNFILVRVILEDFLLHDWHPSFGTLVLLHVLISSALSSTSRLVSVNVICVFAAIDALTKLLAGIYIYYLSALPTRKGCILISSFGIGGSVFSFLQILNLKLRVYVPTITIAFLVFCIICAWIVLNLVNTWFISKALMFFDKCMESPELAEEMMEERYKSPTRCLCDLRSTIEFFHPFVLTFKPFDFALNRWPNYYKLVTLHARFLAFFPNKTERMLHVASFLNNIRYIASTEVYIIQYKKIANERETMMTNEIREQINEVQSKIDFITSLLRRFWEGVLQKNTDSFWDYAGEISREMEKVDREIKELRTTYPNQKEVFKIQLAYVRGILYDYNREEELLQEFNALRTAGSLLIDTSAKAAVRLFPILSDVIYMLKENEEVFNEENTENDDSDHNEFGIALGRMISQSHLGNVNFGMIFLIIGTVFSMGCFLLFMNYYKSKVVDSGTRTLGAINSWGRLAYSITRIVFYSNVYPLWRDNIIDTTPTLMQEIAPTLHEMLPTHFLNSFFLLEYSIELKKLLEECSVGLTAAGESSFYAKVYTERDSEGMTFQDRVLQLCIAVSSLCQTTTVAQIYNPENLMSINTHALALEPAVANLTDFALTIANRDFTSESLAVSTWVVLAILSVLLLLALPFLLQLFIILLRQDSITYNFAQIPNSEIRAVAKKFGLATSQEADSQAIAELSSNRRSSNHIATIFTVVLLFSPYIIMCLYYYYECKVYVADFHFHSSKLGLLRRSFAFTYAGVVRLAEIIAHDEIPSSSYAETRGQMVLKGLFVTKSSSKTLSDFGYGNSSTASLFYTTENIIPQYPEVDNPSLIERMLNSDFLNSFDLLYRNLALEFYTAVPNPLSTRVKTLVYWFTSYAGDNREQPYFQVVEESIRSHLSSFDGIWNSIILYTWQFFMTIVAILFLRREASQIKKILFFYHHLDPATILRSDETLALITTGKYMKNEADFSFTQASYILSQISDGIILLDRSMTINDLNIAASEMLDVYEPIGKHIEDIVGEETRLKLEIEQILVGQFPPQLELDIEIVTKDKRKKYLSVACLFMTSHGKANDEEYTKIESIVLVLEDKTEFQARSALIKKETENISRMLERVMPTNIVSKIESGAKTIAFVSQSVSFGLVHIHVNKEWDQGSQDQFIFLDNIYSAFDQKMQEFEHITKVRKYARTYVYAAGLFSSKIKPRDHAEQAVQYALSLLHIAREISKESGVEVVLAIGIHTGGPVVAGIMGLSRPSFQTITPVFTIADQLMASGERGKIHISRSVYELVYSSGFSILERGDIRTKGGDIIATYMVSEPSGLE